MIQSYLKSGRRDGVKGPHRVNPGLPVLPFELQVIVSTIRGRCHLVRAVTVAVHVLRPGRSVGDLRPLWPVIHTARVIHAVIAHLSRVIFVGRVGSLLAGEEPIIPAPFLTGYRHFLASSSVQRDNIPWLYDTYLLGD